MDTKILTQVREQAAAIDDLKAELRAADEDRAELRRQLDAKHQESERLRGQAGKMERIEREFAEIKELIAGSQQTLQRELINEWAITVAPHMKTTNREVQDLREQQTELKKSLKEMLAEFDALTHGTAANITKLFTEQINASGAVVYEKNEQARSVLKKLHAFNEETLKRQQEAIDSLLEVASTYGNNFAHALNNSAQLNHQSTQLVNKLDTAVVKFDKLTSGTIKEVAESAKQSITETSTTAINEMKNARLKATQVVKGFGNMLTAHPLLTVMGSMVGVCLVSLLVGLMLGKRAVIGNANDITMKATQEMINQLQPSIGQLNEQAQGLNVKVEQAQMWNALTEGMNFEQQQAFIANVRERARQGRLFSHDPGNPLRSMLEQTKQHGQTINVSERRKRRN